ncbi:MAG: helix-turn-helix domain-containing protein [Betaproteobacteria bacterium]|nr:helix-turn-helix domain-containing protein [Betaproteobacteria bacterium]
MQDQLKDAIRRYSAKHSNHDGLALPPVPGLRMMCVESPRGKPHSTYRPLVCLVLQGAKHLLVGTQESICLAGQSVIVSADMPVTGQVVEASARKPYMALAVELDMALLRELGDRFAATASVAVPRTRTLFLQKTEDAIMDCAIRLMRLIGRPDAIPVLHAGLMKELHYWLLSGPHGAQLRAIAAWESISSRLGRAVAILREDFRDRIPAERLADAAVMGLTAFHRHFKALTSLTPGQYQKRLRLIEARRLMLYESVNASTAAFEVGYESVSQFTREYGRMFGAPPKRHSRSATTVGGLFATDRPAVPLQD